ncbi:MAG: polysulfide reductase NrfD [Gracilibacteraceae bacterium]|jgi:Ni/Fe-hydrogenase subunit HybB-like protein|nr:polysulfide reductase NrfD [Gracilibacteraceae bacterium]
MTENMKKKPILLAVGAALVGIGLICRLAQSLGLVEVDYQYFPWGVYIAAFLLLAGAASGLIFTALAAELGWLTLAPGGRSRLYGGAAGLYAAAGLAILLDLGRPERVFNMVLSPNFSSWMTWDFIFLALTFVLALLCLFRPGRVAARLAAAGAAGVVAVEGLLFWEAPLTLALFLLEAVLAGLALSLLIAAGERERVRRALLVLLVLAFILNLGGLGGGLYVPTDTALLLAGGAPAPLYWGSLLLGLILPFCLLARKNPSAGPTAAAVILLLGGNFGLKLATLLAEEAVSVSGRINVYTLEWTEWGAALGTVGLALVLARLLPALAAGRRGKEGGYEN